MTSAVCEPRSWGCVLCRFIFGAPETSLGPVCGVQSFKNSIPGGLESWTPGQIRSAVGPSSPWVTQAQASSLLWQNRTCNEVCCLPMGQLIFNPWVVFCLCCWAPALIALFNWEQLVLRAWLVTEVSLQGFGRSSLQLGVLGLPGMGAQGWYKPMGACRAVEGKGTAGVVLLFNLFFCSLFSNLGSLEVPGAEGTAWVWLR